MPVAAPECRRRQHGRGATAIFYRKMAVLVPSGQGDLKSAWEIAQFWLQVAAESSYYIRRRGAAWRSVAAAVYLGQEIRQ